VIIRNIFHGGHDWEVFFLDDKIEEGWKNQKMIEL